MPSVLMRLPAIKFTSTYWKLPIAVARSFALSIHLGRNWLDPTVLNDLDPVSIEIDGTYTLLIEGAVNNVDADTYRFNVVPVSQTVQPLTIGSINQGTITRPGDTRTFTFDVPEYGLYYLDSFTSERDLRVELKSQSEVIYSNRPLNDIDSFDQTSIVALAPGSYEITIDGFGDFISPFSFAFSSVETATEITAGIPVAVELTNPRETKAFRFDAAQGGTVFLDVVSPPTGNGNFYYSLIAPNGDVISITRGLGDADAVTLPTSGTYTLLVEGRVDSIESESFEISVVPVVNPASIPLTVNDITSGQIASPGQSVSYSFTNANRALYYFDSLTAADNINWRIEDASGTVVVSARRFDRSDATDAQGVISLGAGDYTIIADGVGDTTGAFEFRFSDTSTAPVITSGAEVANTFTNPLQSDIYQFEGVAGEELFVDVALAENNSRNVTFQIVAPDGSRFLRSGGSIPDAQTNPLPFDGTYLLIVEGRFNNELLLNYNLSVNTISSGTIELTPGQPVTGTLATAGAEEIYTFDVPEFGVYYFDNLSVVDRNFRFSIEGPTGITVNGSRFDASNPVQLAPGRHQLKIDAIGATTGDFSFSLLSLSAATELTLGTPVAGQLSTPLEAAAFQFNGVKGQRYFLDVVTASDPTSTNIRVFDPTGTNIELVRSLADTEIDALSTSGVYTILIEGQTTNDVADTFEINLLAADDVTTALVPGAVLSGNIAQPGQRQIYTFDIAQFGDYFLDVVAADADLTWSLQGPRGTVATTRDLTDASLTAATLFHDLAPGPYQLTIAGDVATTGEYSFRFANLDSAPVATYGTPTAGALSGPTQSTAFTFDATAGDEVEIAFTDASDPTSARWRLFDPTGRQLAFLNSLASPFTSTLESGTYTILVEGLLANDPTVDVTFSLGLEIVGQHARRSVYRNSLGSGHQCFGNACRSNRDRRLPFGNHDTLVGLLRCFERQR